MEFSDERRQEVTEKVARLLVSRMTRHERSEDEIATELGFKSEYNVSPARRMYESLKDWGLPDWLVYPQSSLDHTVPDPASPDPAQKSRPKPDASGKVPPRKPRTTGEALKLPPASGAEDLLREQIFQQSPLGRRNWWRSSLEDDLNELHRLKEWLVGEKRFVTIRYHEDTREPQYKRDFNEEQWIAMCEAQGEDPQWEAIEVPVPPAAMRSTRQPWRGWTSLIAVYALKNRSIQPLVDALHPNPSSVNVDEHYNIRGKNGATKNGVVTDLRVAAKKLARLVRGGGTGSGKPLPAISRGHLEVKRLFIDPWRDQGYTYEQIFRELEDLGFQTEPKPGAEDKALDLRMVTLLGSLNISDFDLED